MSVIALQSPARLSFAATRRARQTTGSNRSVVDMERICAALHSGLAAYIEKDMRSSFVHRLSLGTQFHSDRGSSQQKGRIDWRSERVRVQLWAEMARVPLA